MRCCCSAIFLCEWLEFCYFCGMKDNKKTDAVMMAFLCIIYFDLFVIGEYLFEFRFQFVNAVRHSDDGAVTVDEK